MFSSVACQTNINIPQRSFLFNSIIKSLEEKPAKVTSVDRSHEAMSAIAIKGVSHIKNLFQGICRSYDAEEFFDVKFKVANDSFLVPAHRLILAAASPYFKQLFRSEQGTGPVIEIHHIDSDTLERLIAFCYTATVLVTKENAERMLKAAIILKLDGAIATCVDFLMDGITVYTMERFYGLEHETKCTLLAQRILEFEQNNFSKICRFPHFVRFDAKKMEALVKSNNLDVSCEEDVLDAIERWYKHNVIDREDHLPNLVACLRLNLFDANTLMNRIRPLPGCELLAYKALSWIHKPLLRKDISLNFTEPREGLSSNWALQTLMAIQTDCMDGDHGYIYRYNNKKNIWVQWEKIEIDAFNFGVVLVEHDLYFIGGQSDGDAINVVRSWNLRTKTWRRLPDLNYARYWSSITQLDGKIYVMGGLAANDRVSNSVEVYTRNNGWEQAADLITPRYGASAVAFNGNIYLIGGYSAGDLQSVERYNPKTNTWTPCAPLLTEHYLPGVAVHNREIYVIGGWIQNPIAIVERYDVKEDKWTKFCILAPALWSPGCISINDQLWTTGGGAQTKYTNMVTIFDTKNSRLGLPQPLPRAGIYYSFTVSKAILKEKIKMTENKEEKNEKKEIKIKEEEKGKEEKEEKNEKEEEKEKEEKEEKKAKEIKTGEEKKEKEEKTEKEEKKENA